MLKANFNGSIRFTGHDGKLDLKFSNIKVNVTGTAGSLTADVTTKDSVKEAVPLAALKLAAGSLEAKDGNLVALTGVPATLTAEGAKAFAYDSNSPYKQGDALDPVTLAVALDANAKLPEPPAFENCEAAVAAGKAPLRKGEPGYAAKLDTDGDGVACESGSGKSTTGGSTTGGATTGGSTTGGSTTGGSTTGGSTTGGSTSGGSTTGGSLAQTGSDVPTGPLLGAAGAMVLAGGAAVYATRRRRDAQG